MASKPTADGVHILADSAYRTGDMLAAIADTGHTAVVKPTESRTARMHRSFRQRFIPGQDCRSTSDFNGQLKDWLPKANHRYSRSRHGRPAELIVSDREMMRELPPVVPDTVFRNAPPCVGERA